MAQQPDGLPETLGLFGLDDVLLLPRGRLPLRVFEPRYRNLVDDALATDHRLIGIIQQGMRADDGAAARAVGCAGRIVSYNEIDDDMRLILVGGVCRFAVPGNATQAGDRGYVSARPDWSAYLGDLESPREAAGRVDRDKIRRLLKDYLDNKGLTADWDTFKAVADEDLVPSLAMVCPFSPIERRDLLETADTGKLAEKVMTLLRRGGHGAGETQTLQ